MVVSGCGFHCLANCTSPFRVLLSCKACVPASLHSWIGHAEGRIILAGYEPGTDGRHKIRAKPFLAWLAESMK